MAEISKITLPSGNTYDIKDATAREMISGGVSFIIAWDGASTPTIANIPAGVVVKYNGTNYTGTLAADNAEAGAFYLIKSSTTPSAETLDIYDEYVPVGVTGNKTWEKIGDTQLNLTDVVTDVTSTTKYMAASASGGGAAWNNKDQVTALTGLGTPTTDTFVKSVSAETNKNLVTTTITGTNGTESVSKVTKSTSKLETTTVPNVTNAGSASTWNFAMGSGANAETLIISGANSTAPTLGTAKTVATGAVSSSGTGSDVLGGLTISNKTVAKVASSATTVATGATSTSGTGDAVVTGVTIGSSAAAITAITPTTDTVIGSDATFTNTQPTVSLTAENTSDTGRASFVQGVSVSKGNQ